MGKTSSDIIGSISLSPNEIFNAKYNFLRKLAGDESAVLVHTINKSDTKRGDVYTNMNAVHVTDDGLIFAATEADYKASPSNIEPLAIEDLKYQIDLISPSGTEIRLRAKNVNGSYKDDFLDIQTGIQKWGVGKKARPCLKLICAVLFILLFVRSVRAHLW